MLGHLIYSYNHLDDARIQQEISKNFYSKFFNGVYVVHSHNGKKFFAYQEYLEDKLIKIKNKGHFAGAADLINKGIDYFNKNKIKNLKYVLVTAADTWMLDVSFLKSIIKRMEKEKKVLAVSSWGTVVYPEKIRGFSSDFFIINIEWNRKTKILPFSYSEFVEKFFDIFSLNYSIPTLEGAFQYYYAKYFLDNFKDNEIWQNRDGKLLRIIEREPVHNKDIKNKKMKLGERFPSWPKIGLYTNPYPKEKQQILKKLKYNFGKYSNKLILAKNLDYYNNYK